MQPNTDSSFDDIPKLYSEKETRVEDNDNNDLEMKVLESENRTITLTDSEPKRNFNISEDAQDDKSIEEINLEDETNDETEHGVNDTEQQIKEDSEMNEEQPIEKKSSESVKITAETNGNQVDIVKASQGVEEQEILIDEKVNIKVQKKGRGVEKRGKKSKILDVSITNSDEHGLKITGVRPKRRKEKSPNHVRVVTKDEENSVEIIELKDKKENQTVLETKVDGKSGFSEIIKDLDTSNQDSKEVSVFS